MLIFGSLISGTLTQGRRREAAALGTRTSGRTPIDRPVLVVNNFAFWSRWGVIFGLLVPI